MDVLNYSSPTSLRTSARCYLGLAAIATAGLSATNVSYDCQLVCWFVNYDLHSCEYMIRCAASRE